MFSVLYFGKIKYFFEEEEYIKQIGIQIRETPKYNKSESISD